MTQRSKKSSIEGDFMEGLVVHFFYEKWANKLKNKDIK